MYLSIIVLSLVYFAVLLMLIDFFIMREFLIEIKEIEWINEDVPFLVFKTKEFLQGNESFNFTTMYLFDFESSGNEIENVIINALKSHLFKNFKISSTLTSIVVADYPEVLTNLPSINLFSKGFLKLLK